MMILFKLIIMMILFKLIILIIKLKFQLKINYFFKHLIYIFHFIIYEQSIINIIQETYKHFHFY